MYDCENSPPAAPSPGSDELLRLVFDSATDFAIFSMDRAGCVTSWNPGAQRLLGYCEADILGRDGDVIFTPEDRAAGAASLERQKALTDGRAEDDRWHMRKDGSRFWASGLMMPLADRGVGFMKILRDRTLQREAMLRLQENEERFRTLATNVPQLVFRSRSNGERSWGSPQWEVFTGLSQEESIGLGWLDAIHPEDRDETLAAWRTAAANKEYYVEHRIRRSEDGQYRWHQTRARPIGDEAEDDRMSDWVGTSSDVHDMRGLQDRQEILLAELQHRTRNLLALVQSIARRTARSSGSLEEFEHVFESRLRALGRVQGLLARVNRSPVDLRTIMQAELAAHVDAEDARLEMGGPRVGLSATSGQAIALAIHELATNAVKYGALAKDSGHLSVQWRTETRIGQERYVVIEWRESGVDMPDGMPTRHVGYGRELIEKALPYQLRAETRLSFERDGVRCVIAVPIIET